MTVVNYICTVLHSLQHGFHVNYVVRPLQYPAAMEAQIWRELPVQGAVGKAAHGYLAVLCLRTLAYAVLSSWIAFLPPPASLPVNLLLQGSTQTLFQLGELSWQPLNPALLTHHPFFCFDHAPTAPKAQVPHHISTLNHSYVFICFPK